MCLRVSYKKKKKYDKNIYLASLKSLKKGVGSGVEFESISERYGSPDPDPNPHQNVTMLRIPNTVFKNEVNIFPVRHLFLLIKILRLFLKNPTFFQVIVWQKGQYDGHIALSPVRQPEK